MPAASILKNSAAVAAGSLVAGIGYASIIERNAFVTREVTMPVLTPGFDTAAGAAHQRYPHAPQPAPQAGLAA